MQRVRFYGFGGSDGGLVARLETLEGRLLFAAAPPYDNSFGTDGRARFDVAGLIENAQTVAVAPDGKIIVTGQAQLPNQPDPHVPGGTTQFRDYVARLNLDGSLDASFGANGVVTLVDTPLGNFGFLGVGRAAGQADGKVLVLGGLFDPTSFYPSRPQGGNPTIPFGEVGPSMIRLNADGSLDTTFGGDGLSTFNTGGPVNFFSEVHVLSDGGILAAGYVSPGNYEAGDTDDMLVVKLNPDGSLDASFGGGDGVQTIGIDDGRSTFDRAEALLVLPDGKLLVGGSSSFTVDMHENSRFAVARLNADGSPDATFGDNGRVVARSPDADPSETWIGGGHRDLVQDLALTADGKIVAVGVGGNIKRLGLLRLNSDGSLDNTFGTNGIVSRLALENAAYSVAAEGDGTLIVRGVGSGDHITPIPAEGGYAHEHRHGGAQVFAGRFDAVGRLIESRTAKDLLDRQQEFTYGNASAFQDDGKIVTVGIFKRPWSEAPPGAQGGDWNQADALAARFDPFALEPDRDPERALGAGGEVAPRMTGRSLVRKGRAYKFRVTFASHEDANAARVVVSGPNGFSADATRTSLRRARGGRVVGTYTVSPPDGRFDQTDNGIYAVSVRDTVAGGAESVLGNFTVRVGRGRLRPVIRLTVP